MAPPLLLAIAALVVVLKTWHGWRLGVVRQAIGLAALGLGVGAAVIGGPLVEPFLDLSLPLPDAARTPLAGVTLGVIVYFIVTLFAAVLFKKTEHQTVGVVRLGYGFTGAVLGLVTGVVLAAALLVAFAAARGHPGIVEELRDGNFSQALHLALRPEPPAPATPKVKDRDRK